MRNLVEDLLLLTRLDEVRPTEREPVDLSVLAADACSDVVALDRTRQVTFDAPHPVVVAGDEAHLRQAICNLVTNAVRHTEPGTPIEVSVRDGQVVVADQGPGVAEEDLPRVFDRFYRAAAARSKPGAGLGLAIVREAAEAHGGKATAESSATGARFRLTLPVAT